MTRTQKQILLAATIVVAVTRWWAMSSSIWDWDEALFSLAVRDFDVVAHRPHPPGFPLFVLAGKAVDVVLQDEFRSLQLISLLGAILLFPAAFFMAWEMGFSFATSLGGALILAFAPNLWFFGGTAFSDVPSLALVVAACALLLRSRRSGPGLFLAGCLILGISSGFRSQNLFVGAVPFLLAAWTFFRQRRYWLVLAGGAVIGVIVIATYVGSGLASYSWPEYQKTLKAHREYIVKTDSWLSPERPPLRKLFDDFFIREFRFYRMSVAIFILSLVAAVMGIVKRRPAPILLILTFGPFAVLAWLILDFMSVSRFSLGYIPLFAILAAEGVRNLALLVVRREDLVEKAVLAGSMLIVSGLILWAAPAINDVRKNESPPARGIRWIRTNLDPTTARILVAEALMPVAEYMLPDYRLFRVRDERAVPLRPSEAADSYILAEGATAEPSGFNFLRPRTSRLWRISRARYFEVSIIPLARRAQFLEGWHEAENIGAETWRWMGRRSVTILPPQADPSELRLTLAVPLDAIPVPNITITLNGKTVDRFRGEHLENPRTYRITDAYADRPNELVIETDQWVNPKERGISGDARDLGLRLQDVSWGPARPIRSRRR